MPKKKPGYTLEKHDQLGLELQTIHDRMNEIIVGLSEHFPVSGVRVSDERKVNPYATAKKIRELILELRSELDDIAIKTLECDSRTDLTQLYFRGSREDHIRNPQPIRPFPRE